MLLFRHCLARSHRIGPQEAIRCSSPPLNAKRHLGAECRLICILIRNIVLHFLLADFDSNLFQ